VQLAHLPLIIDEQAEAALFFTVGRALRDLGVSWDDV